MKPNLHPARASQDVDPFTTDLRRQLPIFYFSHKNLLFRFLLFDKIIQLELPYLALCCRTSSNVRDEDTRIISSKRDFHPKKWKLKKWNTIKIIWPVKIKAYEKIRYRFGFQHIFKNFSNYVSAIIVCSKWREKMAEKRALNYILSALIIIKTRKRHPRNCFLISELVWK